MGPSKGSQRVLIAQWFGDYREAYHRLRDGGPETYYNQRYSVDGTGDFAKQYDRVGVLCFCGTPEYEEVLPNGVHSLGLGLDPGRTDFSKAVRALEKFDPTHLILTTPKIETDALGLEPRRRSPAAVRRHVRH